MKDIKNYLINENNTKELQNAIKSIVETAIKYGLDKVCSSNKEKQEIISCLASGEPYSESLEDDIKEIFYLGLTAEYSADELILPIIQEVAKKHLK